MLDVNGLSVRFGGLAAVTDLSFAVRAGEVLTLMGPNGAGKTSVFDAITGFVKPAGGAVHFEGAPITGLRPHRIAACGICRTFQNNGILREMTVLENVLTGLHKSTRSSLAGVVCGLGPSVRAERDATAVARRQLHDMGIGDLAGRAAGSLSFGQQRLVEISRALVAGARLLLLDEPAVGLSPGERIHLGVILRAVARRGIGIILIEHVQDLVMTVSDRIVVLNDGRNIAEGRPGDIHRNRAVLEAYLGGI